MPERSSPSRVWPVFALFIVLSLAVFAIGGRGFYRGVASKSWPTVEATITSSEPAKRSGKRNRYGVEVGYTYVVDGKPYEAKVFKETATRGTPEWEAQMKQYPVDAAITVHLNPTDPADSILEPGLGTDDYVLTFVPLLVIAFLIRTLAQQSKKQRPA